MGDSACVMHGYSYDSATPDESKQGNGHMEALGDSVSFGRFMNESLSWEKWSTFSHKKYVEEAESYSKPGSVAQKKAFFEAHYKRKAAQKAAAEQESAAANEANGTVIEGQDNANKINGSQRISLKLEPLLVVDEKMDMVKIPDHEMNDGVENGKESSLVAVAEDAKDQKQAEIMGTKYSLEAPKKKPPHKKRFFSKYLCNLYGLFPTEEPNNEPHSATVQKGIIRIAPGSLATAQNGEAPLKTPGGIEGVSKNPAATPPKNRRKKTPTDPSAPGSKTTHRKWLIFSAVSKSSRNHRSQPSSE